MLSALSSSSLRVAAARSRFLAVGVLMRIGFSFFGLRVGLAFGGGAEEDEGGFGLLPSLSFIFGVPDEGVGTDDGCG